MFCYINFSNFLAGMFQVMNQFLQYFDIIFLDSSCSFNLFFRLTRTAFEEVLHLLLASVYFQFFVSTCYFSGGSENLHYHAWSFSFETRLLGRLVLLTNAEVVDLKRSF